MGVARRRPGRRRFRLSVAAGGPALSVDAVFTLRDVTKSYSAGGTEFRLHVPRLDVARGAKLALIGESGSGKSTLLELLAMILRPTSASAFVFRPLARSDVLDVDAAWQRNDSDRLSRWRSRHIGYVLQHGGLLPYLSVRSNIELPRRLLDLPSGSFADDLAARLGIRPQLDKLPAALSVGQRQRVAIARALAHEPPVVIADEPTASLDPLNAERITALLGELADELDVTLIVASHAQALMRDAGFTLLAHTIESGDEARMTVSVSSSEPLAA